MKQTILLGRTWDEAGVALFKAVSCHTPGVVLNLPEIVQEMWQLLAETDLRLGISYVKKVTESI